MRRRRLLGLFVCCYLLLLAASTPAAHAEDLTAGQVRVRFLGHCAFAIESPAGRRLIADPFYDRIGYPVPELEADVLTISSDNTANNNEFFCANEPLILRSAGVHQTPIGEVRGVRAFRDTRQGRIRGENMLFCFEVEGLRMCHFGILGHELDAQARPAIGRVDVLFVPVGGQEALAPPALERTLRALDPRVIFPMYFHTPQLRDIVGLRSLDDFLATEENVRKIGADAVVLEVEEVRKSRRQVIVLRPPEVR